MSDRTDSQKLQEQVDEAEHRGMVLVYQDSREALLYATDGATGDVRVERWFLRWDGVDCQGMELSEGSWQVLVEHLTANH